MVNLPFFGIQKTVQRGFLHVSLVPQKIVSSQMVQKALSEPGEEQHEIKMGLGIFCVCIKVFINRKWAAIGS